MTLPNEEPQGTSPARSAVTFYKHILRVKNLKNEPYPIVRLIGHRGAASKAVQSVAKTDNDLKNFFLSNPDVFIVTGDDVILSEKYCALKKKKEPLKPQEGAIPYSRPKINISNGVAKLSNSLTKQTSNGISAEMKIVCAVKFYFWKLYEKSSFASYPLVRLIGHRGTASIEIQSVVKNPKELKSFLQNFPNLFKTSQRAVTVADSAAREILVLSFYIPKCIEISENNEVSLDKLFQSRNDAPPNVQSFLRNVSELKNYLSKYNDIFKLRGNSVAVNSEFVTKVREHSKNVLPFMISAVSNAVATKELKNVNIKSLLRSPVDSVNRPNNICPPGSSETFSPSPSSSISENGSEIQSLAVQFFMEKLWKFGLCRVVAINDLFKYKSEASPEIQAACGSSIQDFRKFLSQHPQSFIVTLENVLARRNVPRKKWSPPLKGVEEPACTMVLNFFKTFTKDGKPEHIDKLYCNVGKCFTRNDGELLFQSSKDLTTFLEMFPHIFYISEGRVVNILYHDKCSLRELSQRLRSKEEKKENPPQKKEKKENPPQKKEKKKIELECSNPENIAWKEDVLGKTIFLVDPDLCAEIVHCIMEKEKVIALDCEGLNLGADGHMSLIQIATEDGQIYVFDVFSSPDLMTSGNLKDILQSSKILKVMHDCRNDNANLYYQFGVSLKNIFDTRVAHAVISNTVKRKTFPPVGFNKLCSMYAAPINSEKDEFKDIYRKNPAIWLERPLSNDMLAYAALDVACLVPHVYNSMRDMLGGKEATIIRMSDEYSKCAL